MELTKEQIRTLLNVLDKAEYEFATSNNLWVTDRPDTVPDSLKFELDFSNILELIHEQISLLEKLDGNHKRDYPVYSS